MQHRAHLLLLRWRIAKLVELRYRHLLDSKFFAIDVVQENAEPSAGTLDRRERRAKCLRKHNLQRFLARILNDALPAKRKRAKLSQNVCAIGDHREGVENTSPI